MKGSLWQTIRHLLPYFRPHLGSLLIVLLCTSLLTGSALLRPHILKFIIDEAVVNQSYEQLHQAFLLFVGVLAAGIGLGYGQIKVSANIGLSIVQQLKQELYSHVLRLDLSHFNQNQVGWYLSRVESDTEQLKQFCSNITVRMLLDAFTFFAILITLYLTDPQIASWMGGILIILLCLVMLLMTRIRPLYDVVRTRYAKLTGFLSEYIHGAEIIQVFNRNKEVQKELEILGQERYDSEIKASFAEYGTWALFSFVTETCLFAVILYFGLAKIHSGEMSLGTLILFLEFSRQMTWPIHSLSENFNRLQRSTVAAQRVFSLLHTQDKVKDLVLDPGGKISFDKIELEKVFFQYNEDEWAIEDLNLSFQKGEKIAFVGASGGGKSTTINLLCRFYDPVTGSILVDDEDLRLRSLSAWRRSIGLVLQDVFLFPGTVLDNLRAFREDISRDSVIWAAKELGSHRYIEKFPDGYDTVLQERGANLSQGERQLLSFTRAWIAQPELLILDEATANIDPYTELILQESLDRLLAGRTAVVIAHRLTTIEKVDRIYVMSKGKLVESGSHQELLQRKGEYFDLFELQKENAL